ncbi:MAG: spore protease YyaC [Firmicutes bacterium]|nr:spore protease YyaC [Bacillota bacterium]
MKGLEYVSRIHVDDTNGPGSLAKDLWAFIGPILYPQQTPLVILCIGTDRSTGDCLGPLVGSKLVTLGALPPTVQLFGTLDEPVHAGNLDDYLGMLRRDYQQSYVLALDACLGKCENVGYITIKDGPLKPGTGVNKNLTEVGASHIVGVVNVGGFMEYFVLQNTRLSLVMRMADAIAEAIAEMLGSYQSVFHSGMGKSRPMNGGTSLANRGWTAAPVAPSASE